MSTREYPCLVERVIDGDTIDVAVDHGFGIVSKQRIRVVGVNTPEIETPEGLEVKQAVDRWLGPKGEVLTLVAYSRKDAYGRRLADFKRESKSATLCQYILTKGYGAPYSAMTEEPPR